MARQLDGQVEIVGVAGRDDVAPMREFVARHGLEGVPQAADPRGELWTAWDIPGQPAWVFVDGATGEHRRVFGALGEDGLRAEIRALLDG